MKIKIDTHGADNLMDFRGGKSGEACAKHLLDDFYVVTVISNPVRYSRRWQLYKEFAHRMAQQNIKLFTVECALGDRNFEITSADNPMNLQVRTKSELWHKENLINLGIRHLPKNTKYICWIDADIEFMDDNWATHAVHALQHYDIIQLFSQALDMGPNGEIMSMSHSFCYSYVNGKPWGGKKYSGQNFHPGFCWAARKESLEKLGLLYEYSILGSGDHNMILSLIGRWQDSVPTTMHPIYKETIKAWQDNATRHIQGNIGYINCIIRHHFHGKKKNRKYVERWEILKKHQYNPLTDICRNVDGVFELTGAKPGLRDDLRMYFRTRNEDSNDNDD